MPDPRIDAALKDVQEAFARVKEQAATATRTADEVIARANLKPPGLWQRINLWAGVICDRPDCDRERCRRARQAR